MRHKCDMFCLWEGCDSRYKMCKACIHNRASYAHPQKDFRAEIPMMEDNAHLIEYDDYNEYKQWLEEQYKESGFQCKRRDEV